MRDNENTRGWERDGRTHDPVGETIPRTTSWQDAVTGDWEDYPDDHEEYERG